MSYFTHYMILQIYLSISCCFPQKVKLFHSEAHWSCEITMWYFVLWCVSLFSGILFPKSLFLCFILRFQDSLSHIEKNCNINICKYSFERMSRKHISVWFFVQEETISEEWFWRKRKWKTIFLMYRHKHLLVISRVICNIFVDILNKILRHICVNILIS